MIQRIALPEAYILASTTLPGREWFWDVVRLCIRTVQDIDSLEIVDELYASAEADLASATVKLTAPMSAEQFGRLSLDLQALQLQAMNVQLIWSQPQGATLIHQADMRVEYFRREFIKNGMVHHTDSCARVTHVPTGTVARSTCHRSRVRNLDEALMLLRAKLGAVAKGS